MALAHRVEDVNQVKNLKHFSCALFHALFDGLFDGNLNTNLPSWFVTKSSGSL